MGKTYLIEAFVHELMKDGYKYMSIESGDILSKYQGESEKRVKEIFRTAEDCARVFCFWMKSITCVQIVIFGSATS